MQPEILYEIIGYIASILVAVSLTMSSILKLRVINLIGALFFTVYGLVIRAYPVAAVNFFIVLIDLYYLYQMLSGKEFFRLLAVRPDSEYLAYFLNHYAGDIQKFQPGFAFTPSENTLIFFALRNLIPAGLVIGEVRCARTSSADCLYIQLDYAIPGYRDLKIGRFLYQHQAEEFRRRGIRKVYAQPGTPSHARYLRQMGFEPEPQPSGDTLYCLTLR